MWLVIGIPRSQLCHEILHFICVLLVDVQCVIPSGALATNGSGVCYVVLQRPEGQVYSLGNVLIVKQYNSILRGRVLVLTSNFDFMTGPVTALLKYHLRDADDVDSSGFRDEYRLEDVELQASEVHIDAWEPCCLSGREI